MLNLTDEELVILDGKCRPETQKYVDEAKVRLHTISLLSDVPADDAAFIARVLIEARTNGELCHRYTSMHQCEVCKVKKTYRTFSRRSRNHDKGDPDYDHPILIRGVELAKRFVIMEGYPTLGCCSKCFERLLPILSDKLESVECELPGQFATSTKYKKYLNRKCVCGWVGHEGQMKRLPTLMGDGKYAGGCPSCGRENKLFGQTFISIEPGFVVVKVN